MRKTDYISKYKQATGICFGIIAALVILVSQSFYYDYVATADAGVHNNVPADEDEEGHDILTISKDAVTSAVQPIITQTLHFISNIYLDNAAEVQFDIDQKVNFNSYFKTLFRLIISPNAP